jgi:hypothetical protein
METSVAELFFDVKACGFSEHNRTKLTVVCQAMAPRMVSDQHLTNICCGGYDLTNICCGGYDLTNI